MAKRRKRPVGQLIPRKMRDGRTRWSARYVDADGRRTQEVIGYELTPTKAREELDELLRKVRKEHRRKLEPMRCETFFRRWIDDVDQAEERKRSTRAGYRQMIERHLLPEFERMQLAAVEPRHVRVYDERKQREGLGPATRNRHLNLLHLLFKDALEAELVRENPVTIKRPKEPQTEWRILTAPEIGAVELAFRELIAEADNDPEREWRELCRVVFLVVIEANLRRGELRGLRWRNVKLADPAGPWLRVIDTFVMGARDTPKSKAGRRTETIGPEVADELFQHRARSRYAGDDDLVLSHPHTGRPIDPGKYAETFRLALARACITGRVRPFHDGRHTSITHDFASGMSPAAAMTRAGHQSFSTTQRYIHLAGDVFREESLAASARKFGHTLGRKGPDAGLESATGAAGAGAPTGLQNRYGVVARR